MPAGALDHGCLAARRMSGSLAGCSQRETALPPRHGLRLPRGRGSRRLRRQLVQMLSSAAVPGSVRVVARDSVRVKRILAEVKVQASVEQVWRVLTDYTKLPEFVPNLDSCERLPGAPPGRHRLRQRAASQSLYWRLQAEAVLDVREVFRPLGARELHFDLVEGDFQEFAGRWVLEPDPGVVDGLQLATILRYEAAIVPKWSLPSTVVSTVVRCGLPANVQAIAARAEQLAQRRTQAPARFAKRALEDAAAPGRWAATRRPPGAEEVLPAKGPARTAELPRPPAQPLEAKGRVLKPKTPAHYLGTSSVPVPFPAAPPQQPRGWETALAGEQAAPESAPPNAAGCCEVHFRRLDDPLMLHRRVVASITIAAPPAAVWAVLTDYERLPEFVPNLAVCERLATPAGAPERLVRLRQVGAKRLAYMQLHAEAVLAVVESPHSEIQFKQTRGDFQLLQGKFMLQDALPPEARAWGQRPATVLKYAVEVEIPRTAAMLGLLEPLLERCVYADIPANLEAIKRRVECPAEAPPAAGAQAEEPPSRGAKPHGRPSTAELCTDFGLLQAELRAVFGAGGPLPRRTVLRGMRRYDLEEAIAAHGGAGKVTHRMGWAAAYKTRGSRALPPLQQALQAFAAEVGLPAGTLPSRKLLLAAERADLVNRANQWGGLSGVAELIGARVATERPGSQQAFTEAELDGLLSQRRPSRAELAADFSLLAAELRRSFRGGPLPSAVELRAVRRHDLAQAIQDHGGPASVSHRLGWTLGQAPDAGGSPAAGDSGTAGRECPQAAESAAAQLEPAARGGRAGKGGGRKAAAGRRRKGLATDLRQEIDSW